jgi:hypothetical protein
MVAHQKAQRLTLQITRRNGEVDLKRIVNHDYNKSKSVF